MKTFMLVGRAARATLAIALVVLLTGAAGVEPKYKLDKAQSRVLALSGLSSGSEGCSPIKLSGRVAEQNFSGPSVIGFTLAQKDGSRVFINVDPVDLDVAGNMLALGWINDGLQKMLQKGKRVTIRVEACGAAGRVLTLDAVR